MRPIAFIELPGIPSHVEPGWMSDRERSVLRRICNTIQPQHGYVTTRHRSMEDIFTGKFCITVATSLRGLDSASLYNWGKTIGWRGLQHPRLNAFRTASITSKKVTRLPTTDLHPKRKSKNSPSQAAKWILLHLDPLGVTIYLLRSPFQAVTYYLLRPENDADNGCHLFRCHL